MTVSELIAFLQTQPQHLPVVYNCLGEFCSIKADYIWVRELGVMREDGWVPNPHPDKARQSYLVFPGN